MGKKILVPCFDAIMIAFFYSSLVLEIWSFTVYFSEKRRSLLHPNMAQGSFFPLQSYSKKPLRKHVPESVRKYKRNVLMPHLGILGGGGGGQLHDNRSVVLRREGRLAELSR